MSATRPPVAGDVGARRYGGAVVSDAQMYAHLAETSRAEQLPPTVDVGFETTILDYMKMRQAAVVHNWYARVPISKYPEDLRTYEYLLWLSRANVVIEIGSYHGGSALWPVSPRPALPPCSGRDAALLAEAGAARAGPTVARAA